MFKYKNLVISSVSIKLDKANWQRALKDDQTTQFIHANVVNFDKTDAYKHYMLNVMPASFLINPEGIIVDMELREMDLINTFKY